eukprot:364847-Chlamydomonas_euryale.AAC.2
MSQLWLRRRQRHSFEAGSMEHAWLGGWKGVRVLMQASPAAGVHGSKPSCNPRGSSLFRPFSIRGGVWVAVHAARCNQTTTSTTRRTT